MKPWLAPLACAALLGTAGDYLWYQRLQTQPHTLSPSATLLSAPLLSLSTTTTTDTPQSQLAYEPTLMSFCGTLLQRYGTNFNIVSLQDAMMSASIPLKINDVQYHVMVNLFADKSMEFVLDTSINQETGTRFIDKEADSKLDQIEELRLTETRPFSGSFTSRSYTLHPLTLTLEHQAAYRSHLSNVLRAPLPPSPRTTYNPALQ